MSDTTTTAEAVNTHDQIEMARSAGLPDVAVCPHYWQGTREHYRGGWHVWRIGKDLNPGQKNQWADDAKVKVFGATAHREDRPKLLAEALAWAGERYKIEKWKRNRMGAYVDARVNERFPLRRP